jgi:prevent-host-death family protein
MKNNILLDCWQHSKYVNIMLNLSHSRPLNQFQKEAPELLHQFETDKTPIVITINGKAAAVLQDAESYEKLLNRLELLETLAGIRQSLGEFEQGKGVSIHKAFEDLQKKYDLPN